MTQTPPASPTPDPAASQKVTDLEKQLADAAAQVAAVQAQLSEARAADPNHPQVPVPYAGHAPVVMINGQQVPAGQAIDVSAMLGSFFGGAGVGAGVAGAAATAAGGQPQVVTIPPVVTVNGQVVSGGQPVDLASVVGAENLAQIRGALDQLGLGNQLSGLFGPGVTPGAAAGSAPPPAGMYAAPGPASAVYSPGEIPERGSLRAVAWLAAVIVLGLIGVLVYLVATQ